MKIEGLDELQMKLGRMAQAARELNETHTVSMAEILTPDFVSRHTRFADIDALFDVSGFDVKTQEAFEAIPEENLDVFIRAESDFDSWQEMLGSAGQEWAVGKLGL